MRSFRAVVSAFARSITSRALLALLISRTMRSILSLVAIFHSPGRIGLRLLRELYLGLAPEAIFMITKLPRGFVASSS
jgi:hypothetical protein